MAVPDKYGLVFRYLDDTWLACYDKNQIANTIQDKNGIYENLDDFTFYFVEVYFPQQDVCTLKHLYKLVINDSISRIMTSKKFPELMKILRNKVKI